MSDLAENYLRQLQALLPSGPAWTREPDAELTRLLTALADEFARIEERGLDLVREFDPAAANELLPDWERVAALPDPCVGELVTLQERRAAVLARLTGIGRQTPAWFIALAATLGYTATIEEFRPFRVGSQVGKALTSGDWRYAWRLTAPSTTFRVFAAGKSAAGEPLRTWGNALLECALRQVAPPHTVLIIAYEVQP